jgi:P27 family predicted phage terminase small subunit
MPGPPPKPPDRRQGRGARTSTKRAGAGLVALPGGKVEAPPPPAGLLKATRKAWERFWGSSLASLVVPDTDLLALERLFTLYDERARALNGYRKARLVRGSMGQVALSPLAKAIQAFDQEIRALEDRFGLTPMARLRLGVQLGEAAKSLKEMNAGLADPDERPTEEVDPRIRVVGSTADQPRSL